MVRKPGDRTTFSCLRSLRKDLYPFKYVWRERCAKVCKHHAISFLRAAKYKKL